MALVTSAGRFPMFVPTGTGGRFLGVVVEGEAFLIVVRSILRATAVFDALVVSQPPPA